MSLLGNKAEYGEKGSERLKGEKEGMKGGRGEREGGGRGRKRGRGRGIS